MMAGLLHLLGFALLALSQPHHRARVYGENSTVALAVSTQCAIGFIAIGMTLPACVLSQGASFGTLLWVMEMAAAAMAVAFTLTWRPHWLRGLGHCADRLGQRTS